jgi:hypothetical protein
VPPERELRERETAECAPLEHGRCYYRVEVKRERLRPVLVNYERCDLRIHGWLLHRRHHDNFHRHHG